MTLKEFLESTHEEERCPKNLRDNRKERIEVNQEECELRRGNRKHKVVYATQKVANLHKKNKVASHNLSF